MHMPVAPRRGDPVYRDLLGTYLSPQRGSVVLLAVLLFGSIGLQLLAPQVIRYFIDTTQTTGAPDALLLAALAFIAIGVGQRLLSLATRYTSINVGWTATNALRADLALHVLRLDMPFHKAHTPGELIERIDGDVSTMSRFFSRFVVDLLGNGLLIAGVLLLLYFEDWRAGLILTVYTLVTVAVLAGLQNFGARRWTAARQANAEQFGYIEERIAGTEDIRGSGAEAAVLHGLYPLTRNVLHRERAAQVAGNVSFFATNFLAVVGYALGLAIGAYLYSTGAVTIGTAFVIVYYINMLSGPLENIRERAQDLQQASAGIARVGELFRDRPRVRETPRAELPAGALEVAFDRVSFAYADDEGQTTNDERNKNSEFRIQNSEVEAKARNPKSKIQNPKSDDPVLRDVSFTLPAGRVLGVLGRTGSGKTTLTRLLFRLYDPTEGAIRLGGMDIRDVSFSGLRSRVGMVTQDVQLFQASVRDNIAFFDPGIGEEQIVDALARLDLLDWVRAMPEGLSTTLAGGHGMSAGEAQLLAFTRVFLKNPGLVILDEAASRLDPITERRLERAIDHLLQERTAIIIAHSLRTVQRADDILILEGGRVIEYGPRRQLATDSTSRFYRLLQTGLEEALA